MEIFGNILLFLTVELETWLSKPMNEFVRDIKYKIQSCQHQICCVLLYCYVSPDWDRRSMKDQAKGRGKAGEHRGTCSSPVLLCKRSFLLKTHSNTEICGTGWTEYPFCGVFWAKLCGCPFRTKSHVPRNSHPPPLNPSHNEDGDGRHDRLICCIKGLTLTYVLSSYNNCLPIICKQII